MTRNLVATYNQIWSYAKKKSLPHILLPTRSKQFLQALYRNKLKRSKLSSLTIHITTSPICTMYIRYNFPFLYHLLNTPYNVVIRSHQLLPFVHSGLSILCKFQNQLKHIPTTKLYNRDLVRCSKIFHILIY